MIKWRTAKAKKEENFGRFIMKRNKNKWRDGRFQVFGEYSGADEEMKRRMKKSLKKQHLHFYLIMVLPWCGHDDTTGRINK